MSELLDKLGQDNLERLALVAGGRRLSVPKHYGKPPRGGRDTSERLRSLVGEPLAILLVFHFGDCRLYVPKLGASARIDLAQFKRLDRRGLSAQQIAQQLGCSVRTIEQRRAKSRESSRKRNGKDRA